MKYEIRKYKKEDINQMISLWNEIVEVGNAFPQMEKLSEEDGKSFFQSQSYCGVAENEENGDIIGLYILHPNNIGRCGHICNCSYAVKASARGFHIGESLVKDSLKIGKKLNFNILQFNAVVKSNVSALKLYQKLGFTQLGTIPEGFLMADGSYEDIIVHYIKL